MSHSCAGALLSLGLLVSWSPAAAAQNIHVTAPIQSISDGFYAQIGGGWHDDDGSFYFSWQPNVSPPFGGYDPHNDARFGFQAGPLSCNIFGSQGSRRSIVSQSPSLTVINGGTGYFFDGQLQPFVTGLVPVVAAQPQVAYPHLWQRWSQAQALDAAGRQSSVRPATQPSQRTTSSAERGDISVAEIRRQRAHRRTDEVEQLLTQALSAAAQQKWNLAEHYLRNALRRADGAQRATIESQLEQIVARKKR